MEYDVLTAGMGLLEDAPQYIRWVYESIAPYLGKRILEIGSGLGFYSGFFSGFESYCATDIHRHYLDVLRKKLSGLPNASVLEYDVVTGDPRRLTHLGIDTVVCIEVLEHIEKDEVALQNIFRLLKPGGRLVLVIPAMPFIYGSNDSSIGHVRRYSKIDIAKKLRKVNFITERLFFHNMLGIPAWFLNGRILRLKAATSLQLTSFDKVVPFLKVLERALPPVMGLNLIAVARRPDA